MSRNPSSRLGSLYREAKPVKAILGNMVRDSGFTLTIVSATIYATGHIAHSR